MEPTKPQDQTRASLAPPRVDPDAFTLADRPESVTSLVAALDSRPGAEVALDTEADSLHHYFEKACLLQLAFDGRAWLVDPLAPAVDLAPLLSRLSDRPLLLHGADYDLRLLKRGFGFSAARVFDTMIAAQLLGEPQIGLAALAAKRLGVVLDKSSQRADWSERPIPDHRAAYAAADVLHLAALAASLRADLEAAGRLAWHAEECERLLLSPMEPAPPDPENDWRVKGTNALSDRERAFLRELWSAREARAREIDRPPFRVATNERLVEAARLAAAGERDPARLIPSARGLPPAFARAVESAVARAEALAPADWPRRKSGSVRDADPALEAEVRRLKDRRDALARRHALDPGVLAPRALLVVAARLKLETGSVTAEALVAAGASRWRAALLARG